METKIKKQGTISELIMSALDNGWTIQKTDTQLLLFKAGQLQIFELAAPRSTIIAE